MHIPKLKKMFISKKKIAWRRKWQPTPVSLPGKSHGQRSLVDCSPWGRKESGTTEQLTLTVDQPLIKLTEKLKDKSNKIIYNIVKGYS